MDGEQYWQNFSPCDGFFPPTSTAQQAINEMMGRISPKKQNAEPKPPKEDVPKELTFEERVASLEKARGTRIVFLVEKEKSGGLFSFTASSGLTMTDARNFVNTLRSFPPDQNIDLIVDTPGGQFAATEVIVNAMLNHKGIVTVFVPFRATSAGTLISLAASNIYLGQNAFLGPVDCQYNGFSIPTVERHLPRGEGGFAPLWRYMREVCEKTMNCTTNLVRRIMFERADEPDFQNTFLNATKYDHCQPLFYENVEFVGYIRKPQEFPSEIYEIFDAYQKCDVKPSSGGFLNGLL